GCARPGRREVRGEERVGQLPRDDRLRYDALWRSGGGLCGRRLLGLRLDARPGQHLALERPRLVGDDGLLVEEREEPGIADRGLREDRRDAVQTLELLGPMPVRGLPRENPGALLPADARRPPGPRA